MVGTLHNTRKTREWLEHCAQSTLLFHEAVSSSENTARTLVGLGCLNKRSSAILGAVEWPPSLYWICRMRRVGHRSCPVSGRPMRMLRQPRGSKMAQAICSCLSFKSLSPYWLSCFRSCWITERGQKPEKISLSRNLKYSCDRSIRVQTRACQVSYQLVSCLQW